MLMGVKRVRDSSTSCLACLKAIQQGAQSDNILWKMPMTAGPGILQENLPVLLCSGVIFMHRWCQTHKDPCGILSATAALVLQGLQFNFLKISGDPKFLLRPKGRSIIALVRIACWHSSGIITVAVLF